jgi:hypothetical protein
LEARQEVLELEVLFFNLFSKWGNSLRLEEGGGEGEFIEESRRTKGVAKCPECGCGLWYLDEESLERGDKPTEAKCANCGYVIYA